MVYNLLATVKGNEEGIMSSYDELDIDLADLTSLEKILAWMQANEFPLNTLDLIAQDEFCHELLIPYRDRWLVFGLT
jgi:hypothetical protein